MYSSNSIVPHYANLNLISWCLTISNQLTSYEHSPRLTASINLLFPDAEAGEDCGEDFGGGYCACYRAEMVEDFAEVLGYEVAGEVGGQADYYAFYRGKGV